MARKMDTYEQKEFDDLIKELEVKGVDVSEYLKLDLNKLKIIHKGHMKGADVSQYFRKGYKGLSANQMEYVLEGLIDGINIDIYNKKEFKADIMRHVERVMCYAKKRGLSSADIDNAGINQLNYLINAEKAIKSSPLSKAQQKYIDKMKALGVDTLALGFEKNTIKPGVLREIALGYEHGVDASQYFRKGNKLREWQCKEVRLAMEANVDISELNKPELIPEEMANRRLWLECTTEEIRNIAESINPKYKDDTLLRRIASLKEIKDNSSLLPIIMKDIITEYKIDADDKKDLYFFRALFLLDLESIKIKQLSIESLIDDLDKYYMETIKENDELCEKARLMPRNTDEEWKDYHKFDTYRIYQHKQEKMNQFFINNIGKNLKELFDLFQAQEPKTENRQYFNFFTDFKSCYFGERTETMWDKGFN